MSVIIKGMDMPKNDSWVNVRIKEKDGKPIIAFITGEDLEGKYFEIEEVPTTHGRLIDADEIFCKIDGIKGWDYGDESDMAISAAEALSAIDDSPTVIEAEVSE